MLDEKAIAVLREAKQRLLEERKALDTSIKLANLAIGTLTDEEKNRQEPATTRNAA